MSSAEAATVSPNKRPISVTILAWIYIAVGALGVVFRFHGLLGQGAFPWGGLSVELVEVGAIVCGAFMLREHNWARWLAVAWIIFHVVISVGAWRELAVHSVICAVIIWILFRPAATRYFRGAPIGPG
ncbi:MAG TPA: hypothetical protein VKS20_07280 [Candidatus Acidoferrales bacterium]|nr:hypothetical protein [Candidatus Acidoferrales bacterium]